MDKGRVMDGWVVLFTLAAPALGGATELWAQVFLALGVGLILIDPPRRWPRGWLVLAAGTLAGLGALGFAPARFFSDLPLRASLAQAGEMTLPETLSLQPWVTAESFAVLCVGLLWTLYLLTRTWTLRRSTLLQWYAAGILVLAGLALAAWVFGWKPPFWQPHQGAFGFFPNRNQTGNTLAVASVVLLALGLHERDRGRRSWLLWLVGYALLGVSLVLAGSRAGLILFFAGSLAWLLWIGFRSRNLRRFSLGFSGVLLLLTAFLSVSGPTVERLIRPGQPMPSLVDDLAARFDPGALELMRDAKWHGVGLGNFEGVFAPYARQVGMRSRAVHPESDWFWAGIELGWGAPALIFGVAIVWLIRHRPRSGERDFHLRSALVIAGGVFLVHGFADVSGHRPGSLWPVLLLVALIREPAASDAGPGAAQPGAAWGWRALSVPILMVAGLMGGSVVGANGLPTSARDERLRLEIPRWMSRGEFATARAQADQVLARAPLAWDAHFLRGLAGVYGGAPLVEPLRDFARARFLAPRDPELPMAEASAWLRRMPSLAFGAWREALRRAGPARGQVYERILRIGHELPGVEEELFALALGDPELAVVLLERVGRDEFRIELERWRRQDPGLERMTPSQRERVLLLWARKGDVALLEQELALRPGWSEEGWCVEAALLARRGDHRLACAIVESRLTKPTVPGSPAIPRSLDALRIDFYRLTNDVVAGYAYYDGLLREDRPDDAARVLARLTQMPGCPAYLHYLEGQLQASRGQWNDAWRAYQRYLLRSRS